MIVVDTSAIMAILLNEKQAGEFAQTIEECGLALVSAGNAIKPERSAIGGSTGFPASAMGANRAR